MAAFLMVAGLMWTTPRWSWLLHAFDNTAAAAATLRRGGGVCRVLMDSQPLGSAGVHRPTVLDATSTHVCGGEFCGPQAPGTRDCRTWFAWSELGTDSDEEDERRTRRTRKCVLTQELTKLGAFSMGAGYI